MQYTREDEEYDRLRRLKGDRDRERNKKFAGKRKKKQRKAGRKRVLKGY